MSPSAEIIGAAALIADELMQLDLEKLVIQHVNLREAVLEMLDESEHPAAKRSFCVDCRPKTCKHLPRHSIKRICKGQRFFNAPLHYAEEGFTSARLREAAPCVLRGPKLSTKCTDSLVLLYPAPLLLRAPTRRDHSQ